MTEPAPPPPRSGPLDEHVLVERARAGDADAFAALYRSHVHDIHAFAWRRSGTQHAAEDVTAATFERALRNLGSFRWRGERSFRRWLFGIAANEASEHHRGEARHRTPRAQAANARIHAGAGPPADAHLDHQLSDVDAAHLRRALAALNPRYEQALSLRYLSDLEPDECAAALGVRTPTFAVVLHRASAALRKALTADPPEET